MNNQNYFLVLMSFLYILCLVSAQQNSGSFPIPFPSNRLGGLSKSTPQPSVHGGENQIKAPNPAEAMLPSHNKVTDQSAVTTTPQPTHPKTDSLPKTSTAVASNTPKPSGVTAGNTTTSSSNCHVINGIGLHLVFASGMIGIFVWLGGHSF